MSFQQNVLILAENSVAKIAKSGNVP